MVVADDYVSDKESDFLVECCGCWSKISEACKNPKKAVRNAAIA